MAKCSFCDWDNDASAAFCANPDCGKYLKWRGRDDGPPSPAVDPAPATQAPETPPPSSGPQPISSTTPPTGRVSRPSPNPTSTGRAGPAGPRPGTVPTARSGPKYALTRQRAEPVIVERIDEPEPPPPASGTGSKD